MLSRCDFEDACEGFEDELNEIIYPILEVVADGGIRFNEMDKYTMVEALWKVQLRPTSYADVSQVNITSKYVELVRTLSERYFGDRQLISFNNTGNSMWIITQVEQ